MYVAMVHQFSLQPVHHSPMTVFSPANADLVAVNSAVPRLVRGKSGRSVDAVIVGSRRQARSSSHTAFYVGRISS